MFREASEQVLWAISPLRGRDELKSLVANSLSIYKLLNQSNYQNTGKYP